MVELGIIGWKHGSKLGASKLPRLANARGTMHPPSAMRSGAGTSTPGDNAGSQSEFRLVLHLAEV
ncbi:hypothetical protein ACHAP8_003623 [Fusarium lateritium]